MGKDKLYIIYVLISITSLFFLIIALNDLVFVNAVIIAHISLNRIGTWQYWVLIVSFTVFVYFMYMSIANINDIKKFKDMMNSTSKKTFIENLPDLERISKKFGEKYKDNLKSAKHKWGIKR